MRTLSPKVRTMIWIEAISIMVMVLAVLWLVIDVHSLLNSRATEKQATNAAKVQNCYQRQEQGPLTGDILIAIEQVIISARDATKGLLRAFPHGPAVVPRQRAVDRYQRAIGRMEDFRATISAQTPTRKECAELARKLGVKH